MKVVSLRLTHNVELPNGKVTSFIDPSFHIEFNTTHFTVMAPSGKVICVPIHAVLYWTPELTDVTDPVAKLAEYLEATVPSPSVDPGTSEKGVTGKTKEGKQKSLNGTTGDKKEKVSKGNKA